MTSTELDPNVQYAKMPEVKEDSDFPEGISFKNGNGHLIRSRQWVPERKEDIRALVFHFHGYLDHVQMRGCKNLGHALRSKGFALFGADMEGHGRSEGLRGYVMWETLVADANHFMELVQKDYPNMPYFICGHSMGGALSLYLGHTRYLAGNKQFIAVVALAPAIIAFDDPGCCPIWFLSNCIVPCCPTYPCPLFPAPPPSKIYKEKANMEEACKDPLSIWEPVRLKMGESLLELFHRVENLIPQISCPFIVFQGDEDETTDKRGAIMLFERSATKKEDKELVLKPKYGHDLLTDRVCEEVRPAMIEFMEKRLQLRSAEPAPIR